MKKHNVSTITYHTINICITIPNVNPNANTKLTNILNNLWPIAWYITNNAKIVNYTSS